MARRLAPVPQAITWNPTAQPRRRSPEIAPEESDPTSAAYGLKPVKPCEQESPLLQIQTLVMPPQRSGRMTRNNTKSTPIGVSR